MKNSGKTESKGSRLSSFLPKSLNQSKQPIDDMISSLQTDVETQTEIVKAHTGALFLSEFNK